MPVNCYCCTEQILLFGALVCAVLAQDAAPVVAASAAAGQTTGTSQVQARHGFGGFGGYPIYGGYPIGYGYGYPLPYPYLYGYGYGYPGFGLPYPLFG